ncbi:alpha/beta hydrolase [Rhodococcus artemisiae]|uniref:Alpha/beta hydrolase n=1 Tax=Rhodococcus artemisiae TaxID=714159 RepID=A0ABU7LDR2_9NOCA|nr:alpha/beta hydrolase [Rhodococcus artemisiae]MEE2059678.1 alpha/beta hydrolase [Rhodococcus artemisiae]
MALDEHVSQLIDALNSQGFTSFEQFSVEQARGVVDTFTGLQATAQDVARVENLSYPGEVGDLPLRIYVPEGTGPRPVVLYLHGGGFIGGSIDVADEPCRAVANGTGAIVVSAEYRLAPEHPFPAAPDDAYAALIWVAARIADFGGDPDNIVLAGDSAGGNLAAVTALRTRDEGGPRLRGQVLIYPVIDPNSDFPSTREYADGYIITKPGLDWFWNHYLAGPGDASNPYAVPSRADDLSGLPPALVLTNEYEVGRDEAEDYAARLQDAGVDSVVRRFDGLVHGVFWMSGAVPRSSEVLAAVCDHVRSVTAPSTVR